MSSYRFPLPTSSGIPAANGLAEGALATLLEQQAQTLGLQLPCPECGTLCAMTREPRTLHRPGGSVTPNEPVGHCPACRRDFFPQWPLLRLDNHAYSPAARRLIVEAAARLSSFVDAAFALELAGLPLCPQHVRTLALEAGQELVQQRDAQAARGQRRLPIRVAQTPELVAVEVDGGRLRTRAADAGPGFHDAENKEDKVACLVMLQGEVFTQDLQPEPPPSFLQPRRVERLVRRMAGQAGEALPETADPAAAAAAEPWAPRKRLRTCVASMANSTAFGRMVAAEAQQRDFYRPSRKAFVADGAAYNWTLQRTHFADFEPIVDFLHVLCYVYAAAWAVRSTAAERWDQYVAWLRACWQGRVDDVLADLRTWQGRVGLYFTRVALAHPQTAGS